MYDEAEKTAAAYPEIAADRTPLQDAMSSCHSSIGALEKVTEVLADKLRVVLRDTEPKDSAEKAVTAVDVRSEHVRDVAHIQRRIDATSSLLARIVDRLEV